MRKLYAGRQAIDPCNAWLTFRVEERYDEDLLAVTEARVTTLGLMKPGQPVNLERSLRAGDRFGGHFVQGHVDSVGTIENVRPDGDAHWLTISFPSALAPMLIPKGSVTVDGISLTVAALRERQFDVMIIPFTWSHTNLSSLSVRDQVNLECDMLGKYVVRGAELFEKTRP